MTSKIKVNILADGGDNSIITSDGAGSFTASSSLASSVQSVGGIQNTPSFFAYQSSVQSIPNTTVTTVQYNTVLYDTNSCYSISTYRFTPTVAGKYYFGMTVRFDNVNSSRCIGYLFKNANIYNLDEMWSDSGGGPDLSPKNYAIMDMNGTTDYAEAKCFHDKGFSVNTNPINEAINFFGYKLIGA
jgi:hypothetical protein